MLVDSYENFFDGKLVDAALEILRRSGVDARVLPRPKSIGQIAFELGDVDRAQEIAERNIVILREAIRDGSAIVALEPSSVACVKKDYPYFCDDDDARAVYDNVFDFCSYLLAAIRAYCRRLSRALPFSRARRRRRRDRDAGGNAA